MRGKVNRIREELKTVERRIDTLDKHLMHGEHLKNYQKKRRQYDALYSLYETARKATGFGVERKAQKALNAANAYYDLHRAEIAMFDNAEKYLRDVMQGRFDPKKLPDYKMAGGATRKLPKRKRCIGSIPC